ncbi:ribonuclease P protein component [Hirschia maritima]|uniref:ribonuclease P protein component n=1 Tax=Hirschia maritima TaxID=1121961 RepID=UPI00036CEF55|nr:ribonuclease P protein component [Hirschia maritima]
MASTTLNETNIDRVERLRVRRAFLFVAKGYAEKRRSVVIQARPRPNQLSDNQAPTDSSQQSAAPSDKQLTAGAGFTATKKIGGAVTRNRAKRRLREASNQFMRQHALADVDYVFIARRDTATRNWDGLLDDVESALLSLRQKILSGDPPDPKPNRFGNHRPKKR